MISENPTENNENHRKLRFKMSPAPQIEVVTFLTTSLARAIAVISENPIENQQNLINLFLKMCPTPQVEVVTFADELHPLQTVAGNFFYNTISLKQSCQGLFEGGANLISWSSLHPLQQLLGFF